MNNEMNNLALASVLAAMAAENETSAEVDVLTETSAENVEMVVEGAENTETATGAAEVEQSTETKVETRGRKPTFDDRWKLIDTLSQIKEQGHASVSRHLKLQLVALGYLSVEEVKKASRGRPAFNFNLTGKANSRLALSKNWKRPVVETPEPEVVTAAEPEVVTAETTAAE